MDGASRRRHMSCCSPVKPLTNYRQSEAATEFVRKSHPIRVTRDPESTSVWSAVCENEIEYKNINPRHGYT